MEKSVPNQFINPLNNFQLFGKFQILIMKRLLLLLVLACCCASINAQETRSLQGTPVMEVNAYLAHLRTSEAGSRNLNSSSTRLTGLLQDVQPAVYYLRGEVKAYGEHPTSLYTNVSSLPEVEAAIANKESIEMVTITVNQISDLNGRIDLSVLSSFPNLKYVYILSTIETSGTVISGLVQNTNGRFGVFYKIDKGS